MDLALVVLLIAGPVGAIDVIYFHLWKFRLFEQPQSVKEEITHVLRGFLAPTATLILLLGHPQGFWFWTVAGLFAIDTVNSLLDVVFEPNSRYSVACASQRVGGPFFRYDHDGRSDGSVPGVRLGYAVQRQRHRDTLWRFLA